MNNFEKQSEKQIPSVFLNQLEDVLLEEYIIILLVTIQALYDYFNV